MLARTAGTVVTTRSPDGVQSPAGKTRLCEGNARSWYVHAGYSGVSLSSTLCTSVASGATSAVLMSVLKKVCCWSSAWISCARCRSTNRPAEKMGMSHPTKATTVVMTTPQSRYRDALTNDRKPMALV
jgi:hypothetical protein